MTTLSAAKIGQTHIDSCTDPQTGWMQIVLHIEKVLEGLSLLINNVEFVCA